MSTSLDERLHRYFDDLPSLDGTGDVQRAMSRARSRHRHQIVGLVGCIVVVLAGLGIAGATLLDDSSPGPVVIEGEESVSGQRWVVGSGTDIGHTETAHLVGDDVLVGEMWTEYEANPELMPQEVWRDDGSGTEILDLGIGYVHQVISTGDVLYAVGNMDDDGRLGSSVPEPGRLALARSSDTGVTWDVTLPDVELPDDMTDLALAAGEGFLVVQVNNRSAEPGDLSDIFHTFEQDLDGPIATTESSTLSTPRLYGSPGGVVTSPLSDAQLWTSDGMEWTEETTGGWTIVTVHDDTPVLLDLETQVIEVDGHRTDLRQLLGLPEPIFSPQLISSNGDDLAVVVRVDDTPDGYRLLRTSDGISWTTTPLLGPPEGFADVSYTNSILTVDADGRVTVDALLVPTTERTVVSEESESIGFPPMAVLVVEPNAPSTPVTGSAPTAMPATTPDIVDGTVTDVELSHQLIERPEDPFVSRTSGGFVDDGFVLWGSVRKPDSDPDEPLGSQFMRWDGAAWATVTPPLVEDDPDDRGWGSTLVADDQGLALIGPVDGADDTQLIESTDGGRTWTTTALPLEIHAHTFPAWNRSASHLLIGTFGGPTWFGNDGTYEESSRLETPGGAYDVTPVGDDLWPEGSKDVGGNQVPWTMKLDGDGTVEEWTRDDNTLRTNHVFPLRGDIVTVEAKPPPLLTTTVSGPGGEVVLNEIDGLEDFLLYDVRATGDELIIVGAEGRSSMLTGTGELSNAVTILLTSDGVSWSRYDIALDEDLDVSGNLIAVTDDRLLISLSAEDAVTGEPFSGAEFAIVDR